MGEGQRRLAGLGLDHRNAVPFGKSGQRGGSFGVENAAARDDDRLLGLAQRADGAGKLVFVRPHPAGSP